MKTKFENASESYMSCLEAQGYSSNTVASYGNVLSKYMSFVDSADLWEQSAGTAGIMAFIKDMTDSGLKTSTVRYNLKRLESFFDFACDPELGEPLCEKNPVLKRLIPRNKARASEHPHTLTEGEYASVVTAEYRSGEGKKKKAWLRRNAMTVLLLTSGIREQELIDLTPSDLNPSACTLVIRHGKGDKRRTAPYTLIAQRAVERYMKEVRPEFCGDTEPLFGSCYDITYKVTTSEWKPLEKNNVRRLVMQHIAETVGRNDVTVHSLRASCATHWYRKGADVLDIKEVLGHADISTTYIYIRQASEALPSKRIGSIA